MAMAVNISSTGISSEIGLVPYQNGFQFSYEVRILDMKDRYLCDGSIIDALWILTAAHCLQCYNPDTVTIIAGHRYENGTAYHDQQVWVDQIIIHEDYKKNFIEDGNDLALLKLSEALIFNDFVNSISVSSSDIETWNGTAEVRLQNDAGVKAEELTSVRIVSNDECATEYEEIGYNITSGMLCAGETGEEICYGNPGGPLTCNNNQILCGVVSFGAGCGKKDFPVVYTDVSRYVAWITATIGEGEDSAAATTTATVQDSGTDAEGETARSFVEVDLDNMENKCGSNFFYCVEDGSCIKRQFICDLDNDCLNGTDEANCKEHPRNWRRNIYFVCNNGETPAKSGFCNGVSDCEDSSDETKCNFRDSCDDGQFQCQSDGRCIAGSWRNDGVKDCDDGSDEDVEPMPSNFTAVVNECTQTTPDLFQKGWSMEFRHDYLLCNPHSHPLTCVRNEDICDGTTDCPNGEDEADCELINQLDKSDTSFACRNGQRIRESQRCDETLDCTDESDEINCYKWNSPEYSFKLPY